MPTPGRKSTPRKLIGPTRTPRTAPSSRTGKASCPAQSSGYYHEYTVITPGSSTRGARRIITGEEYQEDHYTADHYASFDLINYGC